MPTKWMICLGLALFFLGAPFKGYGEIIGIIGGQDRTGTDPAYAALVAEDGTLTAVSGGNLPPTNGYIDSVAINRSGIGIIGGRSQGGAGPAYAALVAPNGALTQLSGGSFPSTRGEIQSVAINNLGFGIIGGRNRTGTLPSYAALVAPDGTLTALSGTNFPPVQGNILSVAINDSRFGIMGGHRGVGTSRAYAALVAPDGTLTQLSGGNFPSTQGEIHSVAINSLGVGIIGGTDLTGADPAYAAFVAPDGTLTELVGGSFPLTTGTILSVAINESGGGIIGGFKSIGANRFYYTALVAPDGTVTELNDGSFYSTLGRITTVAINNSGAGIIGGADESVGAFPAYAALVAPDGTLTKLGGGNFPSVSGEIWSVSINEAGIGLIGGGDFTGTSPAYAALVAPDGTLTELSGGNFPSTRGVIYSVLLIDEILEVVVPKVLGPGNRFVDGAFALTTEVLPNYAMGHHKMTYESSLLRSDILERSEGGSSWATRGCDTSNSPSPTYSLWLSGFGAYAHSKKERVFPALTSGIGGTMLGLDYLGFENGVIGGGTAYAYNHVHYAKNAGKADIHEEFLTVYGSWNKEHLFVSGALWGGIYQLKSYRNTLNLATSKAKVDGKLFIPHFEMGFPFFMMEGWFLLEPFFMIDWAHNWQGRIREHGPSGLNIKVGRTYVSILRNEIGLRLFQSIRQKWGNIIVEEKGSYVNKIPLHVNKEKAAFVGSVSSFDISVFSNRTENLGALQLSAGFVPCNNKFPSGALSYQGEFGSAFQSHLVSLEIKSVLLIAEFLRELSHFCPQPFFLSLRRRWLFAPYSPDVQRTICQRMVSVLVIDLH